MNPQKILLELVRKANAGDEAAQGALNARQAKLNELNKRMQRGELSARQVSELKRVSEAGSSTDMLYHNRYLLPETEATERNIKSALGKYLKSLEANPAARRREMIRNNNDSLTEYVDEDLPNPITRSPEEMQGKVLIPNVGDTTATGRVVTKYGGFEPQYAIPSHGGPDYPRQQMGWDTDLGWASGETAAKNKQGQFDRVAQDTGLDPLAVTTAMGEKAQLFATPYTNAWIQKAQAIKIPPKAAKAFDDEVRRGNPSYQIKPFPEWVGINHPEARSQMLGLDGYPQLVGARRQSVMLTADQSPKWRDMGFPVMNDLHNAFRIDELRNVDRGSAGYSMYTPEVGASVDPLEIPHQTYSHGIKGRYYGQIEGMVVPPEIMFPDIYVAQRARGLDDNAIINSFMANMQIKQVADQKWLDGVRNWIDENPQGKAGALAGLAAAGIIPAEDAEAGVISGFAKGGKEAAGLMLKSQGDRMRDAVEMGYDIDTPLYHGTSKDITEFKPSESGNLGAGVYFTPHARSASNRAQIAKYRKDRSPDDAANVIPAYIKKDLNFFDLNNSPIIDIDQQKLKDAGYDGVRRFENDELIEVNVFDPKNIRSVNAEFNPANKDSRNILAGVAAAPTSFDLFNQSRDEYNNSIMSHGLPTKSALGGLGVASELGAKEWAADWAGLIDYASPWARIYSGLTGNTLEGNTKEALGYDQTLEEFNTDQSGASDQLKSAVRGGIPLLLP